MTRPKRHHYLPISYQQGFAHDGKLIVYDCELKQYRIQTPLNTGLEQNLNTYIDQDGRKQTIESELAKIEGRTKVILQKIDKHQLINDSDRSTLSLFISLLMIRVPVSDKEVAEFGDRLHKKFLKEIFATEEKTKAIMEKHLPKEGSRLQARDIMSFVQRENYTVVPNRDDLVISKIPVATELSKDLLNLNWLIIYSPKGEPFVTTDNPFSIALPQTIVLKGIRGFDPSSPNVKIIVPLSQKASLLINSEGVEGVHAASKRDARLINIKVTENCDRFVIASDEALLRHLVRITQVDKLSRKDRFRLIDLFGRPI